MISSAISESVSELVSVVTEGALDEFGREVDDEGEWERGGMEFSERERRGAVEEPEEFGRLFPDDVLFLCHGFTWEAFWRSGKWLSEEEWRTEGEEFGEAWTPREDGGGVRVPTPLPAPPAPEPEPAPPALPADADF
jgi:hypothetical protein